MAARIEPARAASVPYLVDLRRLCAADLHELLEEEIRTWRDQLHWDFSKSADLVRRFVDMRALQGCALIHGGQVIGYAYLVIEELKGLIGDLYVRQAFRSPENENWLLEYLIASMMSGRRTHRIESQLLMLGCDPRRELPASAFVKKFPRNFMMLEMEARPNAFPMRRRVPGNIHIERWSEHYQEPAAQLIAASYQDHVDAQINDQYQSVAGARRFLFNIVQYPGCGAFFRPASAAAFDLNTGRLCGVSLASLVAPDCGHITQLCVTPEARRTGIGYELLRHSLAMLREYGCQHASLTVTANNTAVSLYERIGFATRHQFWACVWEGF